MQWRGLNHDGVSAETGLLDSWPEGGPKLLWKTEGLGEGYSNISFANGMIYSLGDREDGCYLYALDVDGGKERWSLRIGERGAGKGNPYAFPGPRCTPATDGSRVFAIGQFGDLLSADAKTGKELWRLNVEEQLGGGVMLNKGDSGVTWDYSMSPIIDGDRVVLPIGGKDGTVIAFERDADAFKPIWRSSDVSDRAPYSSVVPVTIGKVPQYLLFSDKRIAGLDAASGKLLWSVDRPGKVAVCSDPVYWLDGENTCYVMVSSGYGVGANGIKVVAQDGKFQAEEIFAKPKLESHHGGLVQMGGHFYMLTQRELVCVDPKTGETLWNNRSVGKGSILGVDGKLIVRSEGSDGTVALVEASPGGYKEFSRFDQPERSDKFSWTYPVVYEGKLYLRDQGLLLCYELK